MELRAGERITVRELVQGALIPSANDAADRARARRGRRLDEPLRLVDEPEGTQLGLADTHFVNPHGLDVPGHVSSARDVVRCSRRARESR